MASQVAPTDAGNAGTATGRAGSSLRAHAAAAARHPLTHAVARRLALAVPLLLVVSALSFVLESLTPGDAARSILGPTATPDAYDKLRHALGLNLPLYAQYWRWLHQAFAGNLGHSLYTGQAVTQTVLQRLPVTVSLIVGALLVSLVVGAGLGMVSAVRGGVPGRIADLLSLVGFALPAFWVGAELIVLFAVKLRLFPATGFVSFSQSPTGWLRSLVLPVVALSFYGIAATARQTREAMLDVLASEHIRMAWANGIPARSIYCRHALKNASTRVVTLLGVQAVTLLGATVLVENVFALPGLGSLVVTASTQHDLPVVEGVAVCFAIIVVAINLLIDLASAALDPRVRVR
jgi:peptide/nickel transport system permease protein